ncbi:IS5 family transposase [Methylobacter sp. YRD-M1]|uniref:IS5 family transposase n=1 Tax=Methylobacter sp. YRD-M1 TaxID=2911520 RepID=UPI00227BABEC|nr:IS5 family transposase [Methylobacter sp. YRD-M1]WAK00373.1 IS5 family transposase [Methylobacter sp. YRD-M1]WAK01006.1 IS5 family transposase [Methylobacter sp. YRD-M1]WAK01493.1 IS5 family transposase [Methylobacter sp. YRD-M1]WAK01584.1 IS5 family transposase [Methylobacter sp. YRD-M1]WAK02460.1 IS5 family transposase [Methylobacter sp. YRD-M1]
MRKVYPSDISREQFEPIKVLLENARKKTRPRTVDLYEVFCAILYLLKSGCQWRMLPSDFPKWRTVHHYFALWSEKSEGGTSLLEQALKKNQVGEARTRQGRNAKTSFCIVDAQSVKNTDCARRKGYDAGKKVSGIKRHIVVDTQGLPHAIVVTTANVTDRQGALMAIEQHAVDLSAVTSLLVDGAYTGQPFAESVRTLIGAEVQVAKRHELHAFAVMPQRWVVERSFAWLEKCRRLWKNTERLLNTSLQFVNLAFLVLLLRRY